MIGKPRLAPLLDPVAVENEGSIALDAVAEIPGAHKRHAFRLMKATICQTKKRFTYESQNNHKRFGGESQDATDRRTQKKHV
jgi:hypothetical protein